MTLFTAEKTCVGPAFDVLTHSSLMLYSIHLVRHGLQRPLIMNFPFYVNCWGNCYQKFNLKKYQPKKNRTSCQTQAAIGHSTPAHRGGHVHNRSRRREQRWGRQRTNPQAEQPRVDGRPSRKVKARQH